MSWLSLFLLYFPCIALFLLISAILGYLSSILILLIVSPSLSILPLISLVLVSQLRGRYYFLCILIIFCCFVFPYYLFLNFFPLLCLLTVFRLYYSLLSYFDCSVPFLSCFLFHFLLFLSYFLPRCCCFAVVLLLNDVVFSSYVSCRISSHFRVFSPDFMLSF